MIRRIVALLAGLAVAVVLVMLIQKLGHTLYPPPDGLDPADREFMEKYIASLPWGPLAFVVVSYVLSTLVGGWLAATIAGERPLLFAGIVGGFIPAGAIMTVTMIPHPPWFVAGSVVGIVGAAIVGATLASKRGGFGKAV